MNFVEEEDFGLLEGRHLDSIICGLFELVPNLQTNACLTSSVTLSEQCSAERMGWSNGFSSSLRLRKSASSADKQTIRR